MKYIRMSLNTFEYHQIFRISFTTERQPERERERETYRQRDSQPERQPERCNESDRETEKQTDRHTHRDKQAGRQTKHISKTPQTRRERGSHSHALSLGHSNVCYEMRKCVLMLFEYIL